MAPLAALIEVARGARPADLLLLNAQVINVFSGEVETGSVAIYRGRIAGIGDYVETAATIDLEGRYLAPAFIGGHVHIESSMLGVAQYARAVVPHGTLTVVTDLHEIANVGGLAGLRYVLDACRRLPFDLYLMAPSCVPATHLETSGAPLDAADLRRISRWRGVLGLGEMMNYPGVLHGNEGVLAKLKLAKPGLVDGHAPGLSGRDLQAYISAGISSDHESVALAEAREKLARGMYVMIREGSSEKNLAALLPLVTDRTWPRCLLVVDDRSCSDLLEDGDVDAVVRKAIRLGLPPVRAIQLATINPAQRFGLRQMGAVAPGYAANLIALRSLADFKVDMVFHRGRLVAREGEPLFKTSPETTQPLGSSVRVKPFTTAVLRLRASGDTFPVIEVIPGQIVTKKRMERVAADQSGLIQPDVERDILKLAVFERHHATGNIGRGLVKGFGLKQGAIASSIAHDSHNIVAVGTSDADIAEAVREVIRTRGGLAVAAGGSIRASLALPIAGLLSAEPLGDVAADFKLVENAARELGCTLPAPFATLSFLALPVIPELRLTDLGLVDVAQFKIIQPQGGMYAKGF